MFIFWYSLHTLFEIDIHFDIFLASSNTESVAEQRFTRGYEVHRMMPKPHFYRWSSEKIVPDIITFSTLIELCWNPKELYQKINSG